MYGQSRAMGKSEGVNIFYCHGWGSHFDPGKAKIRALSRMGPVDGVTVDTPSIHSWSSRRLQHG